MKKLLMAVVLAACCGASARDLDARLTYSTDGGKTWSAEHPTVRAGATLKIRATYAIADTWEDRDVICADLRCGERFASANRPQKDGSFMQRHATYWKSSKENGAYDWDFDTTGLAPGSHLVRLEIGYWRRRGKVSVARISDDQVIYLTIEGRTGGKDIRK